MGHLLGAAPRGPVARADGVIDRPQSSVSSWLEVGSLQLLDTDHSGIVAFAIDEPRTGDRCRGAGLEINGWVIGRGAPVQGVRAVQDGRRSSLYPLDIRRPDVASDYPTLAHSGASGFSAWAPVEPGGGDWRTRIEILLANGDSVALAEIRGAAALERLVPRPGTRLVTAPDFVIIGTQRGGTTSLHAYLSAHPRVETPSTKELHFVTDRHERGRDWYLGQFPAHLPPETLTGEATPYALLHPRAPRRLQEIAPNAKLIALLRDPVARAYSQYLMEQTRGDEPLDFGDALDAEPDRLAGEEALLAADPAYVSLPHKRFSYMARGDYAPQLARWLEVFRRDQILVLRSEDLYYRTAETFAQVASFLGIDADVSVSFAAHNRTSGPPLTPAIRHRLTTHFAPRNDRLASLLGWDPAWN